MFAIHTMTNHYQTIAQLSDCHINDNNNDINSKENFQSILHCIEKKSPNALIISGDLSQNGNKKDYTFIKKQLNISPIKTIAALSGNHDNSNYLNDILHHYTPNILDLKKWRLILLNTKVDNEIYGLITQKSFNTLENIFKNNQKYIMLFMHHAAFSTVKSVDKNIMLQNANKLFDFIKPYPLVKAISWGHSHQYLHAKKNNLDLFSCPSTFKQFDKNQTKIGYLYFKLFENGNIEHQVIWQ